MNANVIDAVYQDGVFKPLQPITLAENEPVKVVVWATSSSAKTEGRSLFGALRVSGDVSDEDLTWAKHLWDQGLSKQLHLLRDQDDT